MGESLRTGTTDRTTPSRDPERASHDLAEARSILATALIGHVGAVRPDGTPVVLPVAVAPDADRVLFHGSTGSRLFRDLAAGAPVCLTVTHLDGLVLARSAFESSMNYRCLVALGTAEVLADQDKRDALQRLTEHLAPGRWSSLRPMRAKEVAATIVLALPLTEFSVTTRDGGPADPDDADWPIWAGHVPIRTSADPAHPAPGSEIRATPALPRALR
jgi:nitroimidazol reductase NimA-like FMN-containing flavoprotein (pyridoxamine 5'-phosphate oxidase superfamily)